MASHSRLILIVPLLMILIASEARVNNKHDGDEGEAMLGLKGVPGEHFATERKQQSESDHIAMELKSHLPNQQSQILERTDDEGNADSENDERRSKENADSENDERRSKENADSENDERRSKENADSVNDELRQLRSSRNDLIAFSAICTRTLDYFPGNTVIFDDTVSNAGGFYSNNTGQFYCSDNSVYVFSWVLALFASDSSPNFPGMRGISSLNIALNKVKFGPKTNKRHVGYLAISEMTSFTECVTTTPSAATVKIEPWDEDNTHVTLYTGRSSFSGFKLGDPQSVIGFVAELSEESNKFPGDPVRFDRVLQNYGSHYNSVLGVFQCPDNGTYVFSVSAQTRDPAIPWSESRLMMEGEEMLLGPVTHRATEEHDSGSASVTAVTRCQQDLHVYVEAKQAQDFPYNSYAPTLTSFTGFRLYSSEEEENMAVAFMAVLDANLSNPEPGTPIPMRRVLTNIGSGYDVLNASFACPDDKFYMFSLTIHTDTSAHSGIYMDNQLIRRNYNHGSDDGTNGSATVSVIAQCVPGSRVHPRHVSINNRTYMENYCSFAGYKLPGQI